MIKKVQGKASNDLAQVAIQHANTTISIANTFLVWGGIFIAIVTFLSALYFNRDKNNDIKKAISEVLDKINKDEKVRNELIQAILKNDEFKTEFKAMIDLAIRDQLDLDKEGNLYTSDKQNKKGGKEQWTL